MRTFEQLITEYPDKTGRELQEIQKQDRREDEQEIMERNRDKQEFIDDINTNGGYFKGRFGSSQKYVRKITNLTLECGAVFGDIESIVMYTTTDGKDIESIHREKKAFRNIERYSLDGDDRVDSIIWDDIVSKVKDCIIKFDEKEKKWNVAT